HRVHGCGVLAAEQAREAREIWRSREAARAADRDQADPGRTIGANMARDSWIDADSNPHLDAHVAKLEHFTQSMADGVIDKDELEKQESTLVKAMKDAEPALDDKQHAIVTKLLAELTAYSVMRTLHEFNAARVRALKL